MKMENDKNFFYVNPSEENTLPDCVDDYINNQQLVITNLQKHFSKDVKKLSVSEFETAISQIFKK